MIRNLFIFIKLDFITLKQNWKLYLVTPFLAFAVSCFFKDELAAIYFCLYMTMYTSTQLFSISEKNKLDTLYLTLSLSRQDVVIGRYLFILCTQIIASIALTILASILQTAGITAFGDNTFITQLIYGLFIISIFSAIQIPLYFKRGVNKSKLIIIILYMLPVVLFLLSSSQGLAIINRIIDSITNNSTLLIVPIIGEFILLGISCAVSCRLYRSKNI
ncbi:MAG: ABC-2 transporter permease [Clostridiales Family XIII bacterium]|nr:ABC-2 transporter permease [Clostridiales Family XIII bacterium]